jgi:pyruvate formate-lyase activating enzyme-like uncharacterized protein
MAAKAPKPGQRAHDEAAAASVLTMNVEVKGQTLHFCPNALPFRVQVAVRKASGGLPWTAFWNGESAVGEDSLMVMWFVARLANGERVTMEQVEREWLALGDGEFDFSITEPDEVDPESDPES